MSRLADEKRYGKPAKSPRPNSVPAGKLVNYNPTVADKARLKSGEMPLEAAVTTLENAAANSHRISLGGSLDKGGFFVIIREGSKDWETAVSISCWGSDLHKAIRLAGFYLAEVNPDFPSSVQIPMFVDEW